MIKSRRFTPAERKYMLEGGDPFTDEWNRRRNEVCAKHESEVYDSFQDERYQFGRQEYQGYVLREE